MDLPPAWAAAMRAIVERGGTCLVLGAVDSGKSTFCGLLAQTATQAGVRTAVVDSDTGQQDIGPPACVALAWADPAAERLEELHLAGLHFVGATSPVGHLLELVAGAAALAWRAAGQRARLVVVDTTGLIDGPGLGLKWAKVAALDPDTVVALQRTTELEAVLAPYRTSRRPAVVRLPVSSLARTRSTVERAARRQEMFCRYFAGAAPGPLPWDRLAVAGLPLFAGRPLPAAEQLALQDRLGVDVAYAEAGPAGNVAVVRQPPWRRPREWRLVETGNLRSLLVGLAGEGGLTLGAGILRGWPPQAGAFEVTSPVDLAAVRAIKLGYMAVAADGAELGTVRW